jgi:hypothetical protein
MIHVAQSAGAQLFPFLFKFEHQMILQRRVFYGDAGRCRLGLSCLELSHPLRRVTQFLVICVTSLLASANTD